jgi:MFS transporter, OFA family, oxalate/formate antiporter
MSETVKNKGWVVTFAGLGINLALGILYAWSIIKGGIPDSWGWNNADKALPYAIACIVFAFAMIPAGKLQDVIGPRWVATIGGVLTGIGCIIAGLSGSSLTGFVIGFGVLAGIGIGFGYASATPPAVKWFPPQKTGMIAGLVVAGFGLASVYIAPLGTWLLSAFAKATGSIDSATGKEIIEKGVSNTMITFGIGFLIIVTILSQLLKNPHAEAVKAAAAQSTAKKAQVEKSWRAMLGGAQFYILWFMYFIGASAGLTFISVAQDLGKKSLGELAFIAVAVLSVGNAGGRIIAGMISDKIGRQWTLFICFLFQAVVIGSLYFLQAGAGWMIIMLIVLFIGANYGANLSIFPSVTKDYFGLKSYGLNYGILFTAWGVGGLVMPRVNGMILDATGTNGLTFVIIISMLVIGAVLTFVSRSIAIKDKV